MNPTINEKLEALRGQLEAKVSGVDVTDKELEVLQHTGQEGGHQSPEVKSLLAKGLLQMDPDYVWPKRRPSHSWRVSAAGYEYLAKVAGGGVAEKLAEVKSALDRKMTKTGGRLTFSGQSAAPYVVMDFEPEFRERLDHYGTSTQSDGEEQEGWDDEGWERNYARPLRKEVEALLKAADIEGWVVDVGGKGEISVQLPKKKGNAMNPTINQKLEAMRSHLEGAPSSAKQMRNTTKMEDTAEDMVALFKKFEAFYADSEGVLAVEPLTQAKEAAAKALMDLLKYTKQFRQAVMNQHHG